MKKKISKDELFQYKKEIIVTEISLLQGSLDKHFHHRWQLRLLLASFSVAFLGLASTSSELKALKLPWPYALVLTVFLLGLFLMYDSHVVSLVESINERKAKISLALKDMPMMAYDRMYSLDVYVDVRASFNQKSMFKRIGNVLGQPWKHRWDFGVFYLLIVGLWGFGWMIKYGVILDP